MGFAASLGKRRANNPTGEDEGYSRRQEVKEQDPDLLPIPGDAVRVEGQEIDNQVREQHSPGISQRQEGCRG